MQYAVEVSSQNRIEAVRGVDALCPVCRESVIAKVGRIKVHHWSHRANFECDPWWEPETEWHRKWKMCATNQECVEVPVGGHRADIRFDSGFVIELQHSSLSPDQIEERERFYGEMVWILDARRWVDRLFIYDYRERSEYHKLRWKHMAKSWRFAKKPVYLDIHPYTVFNLLSVKIEGEYYDHPDYGVVGGRWTLEKLHPEPTDRVYKNDRTGFDMSCSVIRLHTLHENGFGSVDTIPRDGLQGWIRDATE